MAEPPPELTRDVPMARSTTIRPGGRAELLRRPATLPELERLVARAAVEAVEGVEGVEGVEVGVVGSRSNLLVADDGVRGLIVKLEKDLSTIALDGPRMLCGADARLPAACARAARAGLTGIELGLADGLGEWRAR